jgi:hypothetical protein
MQIISLKGAQAVCSGKEVQITISTGLLMTYSSKFKFAKDSEAAVRIVFICTHFFIHSIFVGLVR